MCIEHVPGQRGGKATLSGKDVLSTRETHATRPPAGWTAPRGYRGESCRKGWRKGRKNIEHGRWRGNRKYCRATGNTRAGQWAAQLLNRKETGLTRQPGAVRFTLLVRETQAVDLLADPCEAQPTRRIGSSSRPLFEIVNLVKLVPRPFFLAAIGVDTPVIGLRRNFSRCLDLLLIYWQVHCNRYRANYRRIFLNFCFTICPLCCLRLLQTEWNSSAQTNARQFFLSPSFSTIGQRQVRTTRGSRSVNLHCARRYSESVFTLMKMILIALGDRNQRNCGTKTKAKGEGNLAESRLLCTSDSRAWW